METETDIKLKPMNIKTEIDLVTDIKVMVTVIGKHTEGKAGCWYRSNVDPGDPPEDPEFEVEKVLFMGVDITKQLEENNFDWYALEMQCLEELDK